MAALLVNVVCCLYAASSKVLWWYIAEKPTSRLEAIHHKRI